MSKSTGAKKTKEKGMAWTEEGFWFGIVESKFKSKLDLNPSKNLS